MLKITLHCKYVWGIRQSPIWIMKQITRCWRNNICHLTVLLPVVRVKAFVHGIICFHLRLFEPDSCTCKYPLFRTIMIINIQLKNKIQWFMKYQWCTDSNDETEIKWQTKLIVIVSTSEIFKIKLLSPILFLLANPFY